MNAAPKFKRERLKQPGKFIKVTLKGMKQSFIALFRNIKKSDYTGNGM